MNQNCEDENMVLQFGKLQCSYASNYGIIQDCGDAISVLESSLLAS